MYSKEGLGEDQTNQERIASYCVMQPVPMIRLQQVLVIIKPAWRWSKAIYYLTADNLAAAKTVHSLNYSKKGIVILMTARVDEWAMNFLHEFDGTPLQNIARGAVDLR